MKNEIHPEVEETTITCACGEEYPTKSTREGIRVEVCSNCHPFYTGKQRKSAAGGMVERFEKKYGIGREGEITEDTEETDEETEEQE